MSFLNSVLESLTGDTAQESRKRKADDDLVGRQDKTSRPNAAPNGLAKSRAASTNAKPSSSQGTTSTSIGKPTKAPQQQSESSMTPKNPPKKGSFAEILARGQQNQAKPIGGITHKPIASVGSKKAILKQHKAVSKNGKHAEGRVSKPGAVNDLVKAGRPIKNSGAKVGYQGTSRPKAQPSHQETAPTKQAPSYKGTMKSSGRNPATARPEPRKPGRPEENPRKGNSRKEEYSDEEEESDGMEDQYDHASDDYSDMDAGWDDVEEEEQVAAREAKKEDAYEQMMLEELKRQKEERKRRMAHGKEREKALR